MALTKCKECGKDVSTTAAACPYCGAPDFLPDEASRKARADQQKEHLKEMLAREKPGSWSSGDAKEDLKHFVAARTKQPSRPGIASNSQANTSPARIIGLIGVAVLCVGVFMPIISVPVIGSINYFNNGKGDGTILMILAVLSLVSILAGVYRLLWVTGILSLGMLLYTYIQFQNNLNSATAKIRSDLVGNPFAGLATGMIRMVQVQWGWAVLVIGAILILVAAGMYEAKR